MESTLTLRRSSSQVVRESPSPTWIAIIVVNLVILLINILNPRRTSTRRTRSKMTQVMTRRVTRKHSRRKVARRRSTTEEEWQGLHCWWLAHRNWNLKWWLLWQWERWWEGFRHCHWCFVTTVLSTIFILYTPMPHGQGWPEGTKWGWE